MRPNGRAPTYGRHPPVHHSRFGDQTHAPSKESVSIDYFRAIDPQLTLDRVFGVIDDTGQAGNQGKPT
jgi:hypothetical protein